MDHQVENDADFRAAARVGGEPVRFDEARVIKPAFQRAEHRIEALDMADLQDQSPFMGDPGKLARIGRMLGDRFFNQHMFASFKKEFGDLEMGRSRRGDGGGIDQFGEFLQ